MSRWSPEQVRKAAPDDASVKAALRLARPGPWSQTGATDSLVWGQCQGSGKTPYQVSVDLTGPAYKCTCPSRKFPCKHAIALLLLWSDGADIDQVGEPSDFADAWVRDRADRVAEQSARAQARAHRPVDEQAQAKRLASRLATMDAGLADFEVWLRDVARGGTVALRGQPASAVETVAARLVDAQCPALASEVRELPALLFGGQDWHPRTMAALGRWWTITRAWQRRDDLSEPDRAAVRGALGWAWSGDEIRAGTTVEDSWLVLGAQRDESGRVAEQRTWLYGVDTGRTVLSLDFAAGSGTLPMPRVTGAVLTGAVAIYPGAEPSRVLLPDDLGPGAAQPFPAGQRIAEALATIADHHARDPLARRTPLLLGDVRLGVDTVSDGAGPDSQGAGLEGSDRAVGPNPGLALSLAGPVPWLALAVTGGHPTTVFGEWTADGFWPLTVVVDGEAVPCG